MDASMPPPHVARSQFRTLRRAGRFSDAPEPTAERRGMGKKNARQIRHYHRPEGSNRRAPQGASFSNGTASPTPTCIRVRLRRHDHERKHSIAVPFLPSDELRSSEIQMPEVGFTSMLRPLRAASQMEVSPSPDKKAGVQ